MRSFARAVVFGSLFQVFVAGYSAVAEDWPDFNPAQAVASKQFLYVSSDLFCSGCKPDFTRVNEKLAPELRALPRFWISSANHPEFQFAESVNTRAALVLLGAEGEIQARRDDNQIDKFVVATGGHVEFNVINALSAPQRIRFSELHYSGFDPAVGGTRKLNKTTSPALFFSLSAALLGDLKEERMAKITLDSMLNLADSVSGGVFDGAKSGRWSDVVYQKSAAKQGQILLAFALGYRHFRDEHYLNAARNVFDFIRTFLLKENGELALGVLAPANTNSADYFKASDSGRSAIGPVQVVPGYSPTASGMILSGICELYPFMPDVETRKAISQIAGAIKRRSPTDLNNINELSWGVRGLIAAYECIGDKESLLTALRFAERVAVFSSPAGFNTQLGGDSGREVLIGVDPLSSLTLADALVRLSHFSGRAELLNLAKRAFSSVVELAGNDADVAAKFLTVDDELRHLPAHLTVVGPRTDRLAEQLFLEALKVPSAFRRVEFWDKSEGPLVNPDVKYPELSRPAAFICTEKRCSLPIFEPEKIMQLWARFKKS